MYRLLAHRWQSRLQDLLRRNTSNENQVETHDDDMEAALDVFLSERRRTRALAIDSMLRHFQSEVEDDEALHDSEMEEDVDEMLADTQNGNQESVDAEDVTQEDNAQQSFDSATMDEDDDTPMSVSPSSRALVSREARTVSISSDDL